MRRVAPEFIKNTLENDLRMASIKRILGALLSAIRGWGYLILFITGGNFVRSSMLHRRGENVKISPTAFFKEPQNIEVGDNTFINHHCCIWAAPSGRITIGSDVLFGPNVAVIASNHGMKLGQLIREQEWKDEDIEIGDDVWLAANVVVTAGTKIGRGCVVGAGSIVTNDLPPYSICCGSPAKVIRQRE